MADLQPAAAIEEDWYAHAFDALYPIVYAHRSIESARPEVEFAAQVLEIQPQDRVFDLCCGNGRHIVHLLRHARNVFGLDFSDALLSHARENVGEQARLVRGDMRALPFENAFDVVLNFFTSFGYFQEQEEDQQVLNSLACALIPGGGFLIDYLNPAFVETHLVPRSSRNIDGYDICEERWIDRAARRINKVTTISTPEGRLVRSSESVRLYTGEQMLAMAERAGLKVTDVYGDYQGHPFEQHRPRMILTGRKSEDG